MRRAVWVCGGMCAWVIAVQVGSADDSSLPRSTGQRSTGLRQLAQSAPAAKPQNKPAAQSASAGPSADELRPEPVVYEHVFELGAPLEEGWLYQREASAVGTLRERFVPTPLSGGANSTSFSVGSRPGPNNKPIVFGDAGTDTDPGEAGEKFTLPKGFVALAEFGTHPNGSAWRIRCEKDESVMAYVPPGTFLQGVTDGPPEAGPEHTVFLDAYYIDVNEITNQQYEQFREAARMAKKRFAPPAVSGDPQHPVLGVNWGGANFYSLWAGKSLPTEAQWEKAARGPSGFPYPWGRGRFVWHRPRTPQQIDVVRSFAGDVSPYGVYDLAGNAREWCADSYTPNYYQELLESNASIPRNPPGAKPFNAQNKHVVKGGSPDWTVWNRAGQVNTDTPKDVGFRCVLNAKSNARAQPNRGDNDG